MASTLIAQGISLDLKRLLLSHALGFAHVLMAYDMRIQAFGSLVPAERNWPTLVQHAANSSSMHEAWVAKLYIMRQLTSIPGCLCFLLVLRST